MKKSLILSILTLVFSLTDVNAGSFSWGISFGFGGGFCAPVYYPPVVCAPVVCATPVVYTQPVVHHIVYTQPVVYTPPVVYTQPVCTVPVVNYYRPDCYRSPVTGTVWVGGASSSHRPVVHRPVVQRRNR